MPVGALFSRGDEPNVKEDGMRVSANAQMRKLSGGAVEEKEVEEEKEEEDLSAGGPVARRVLLEIAGFEKLSDEFFVVRDTTDGRGRGLFVAKPIAAETYLFDYLDSPAFIIDQVEFERRYENPTGTQSGDYAIGITLPDGVHVYLDAQDLLSSKHARFMNHAEDAPTRNCECWTITPPTIDHMCERCSLRHATSLWARSSAGTTAPTIGGGARTRWTRLGAHGGSRRGGPREKSSHTR